MHNPTEQQIYQTIQLRQLGHWLEALPNGFRTVLTASPTPTFMLLGLAVLGIFIMYGKVTHWGNEDTPAWFWWFAGIMIAAIVPAICTSQYRNVTFDLVESKITVTILGMTTFQRSFAEFERFSFYPGYVVNGIDPGGVLYMHFKTDSKMRLLQLRDPDDIRQLQLLILGFMGIKV